MRRRRIKPLLTRPKSSHQSPTRRQSAPAKLPIQSTPAPRPHLRVRAPQRHSHIAVHEPEPIDTPVFSTPRPSRKRRVSETPIRPPRVAETPIRPPRVAETPIRPPRVAETPIRPRRVSETPIRPRRVSETPIRPRRVSETPIRPRRVSESPIRQLRVSKTPLPSAHTPAVAPAAHEVVDVIVSQPPSKRARVRCSPSLSGSRASIADASVSPMHSSALLASPGLLSAHVPLTIESVFSNDEDPSCAPATFGTQRRISFGAAAQRQSQRSYAQPRSHSHSPAKRCASDSARNSDPPHDALPESEPDSTPEPTQRHLSPQAPQVQPPSEPSPEKPSPEPSQRQPSPGLPRQPSDACSPSFPPSQRSPITPNHAPSRLSRPASQLPSPSQRLLASLPPNARTKSLSTARIQGTKSFRRFTMCPSTGNSVCSWGGEIDSPSLTALNVFRKQAQQSNDAPLQLRGRSPARCTPSAPSPTVSDPSPVQQPKRTPAQLRRDPVTTEDLEQIIPETPVRTGNETGRELEHDGEVVLRTEDKVEDNVDVTESTQRATHRDVRIWRSECNNELEDDCSSTQSPCSAALIDNSTQEAREENTKAQDAAVYCRSVLVSIPSGALRSLDKSDSPQ